MRGVWWGWRLVGRGEDALHRKRGIEVCALPPSRQKEGAKTGHGAFIVCPARVHFSGNL